MQISSFGRLLRLSFARSQALDRGCRATSRTELNAARKWQPYSNLPEDTVYSGPTATSGKRVTLRTLRQKYKNGEPISMVTAYDYPSAVHADSAGFDCLLVGDSVGMVVHGHDTTLPVTIADMMTHCRAVSRGAQRPFLIGDLPFGSYETSSKQAVETAIRFMKEGNMDAIKLEGGNAMRAEAASAIVDAGIAVMGHTGLSPQSVSVLGGFGPQGKTADSALLIIKDAIRLWRSGCFAIVLECVPPAIAAAITRAIKIPTIGIGAGPHCSGQVLVYHDLLGMMQHPHHAKVTPKFCKQYANLGTEIEAALGEFNREVKQRSFPSVAHTPYKISESEVTKLSELLKKDNLLEAGEGLHDVHARE